MFRADILETLSITFASPSIPFHKFIANTLRYLAAIFHLCLRLAARQRKKGSFHKIFLIN